MRRVRVRCAANSGWSSRYSNTSRRATKGSPAACVASDAVAVTRARRLRSDAGISAGRAGSGRAARALDNSSTPSVPASASTRIGRSFMRTTVPLCHRALTWPGRLRTLAHGSRMQQLVFAIVQGPPVSWRPPRSALGMIETRAFDELVVVSSQLERIPEPNTRTLALHHDVVAATMEADGVLPFRFGTSLDAGELEGWLAAHAARIRAALGQPGACRDEREAPAAHLRTRPRARLARLRGGPAGRGHAPRPRGSPDRARERRALALPARRPREQPGGIARLPRPAPRGGRAPRAYRAGGVARREQRGRAGPARGRLLVRSAAGPPACGPRGAPGSAP